MNPLDAADFLCIRLEGDRQNMHSVFLCPKILIFSFFRKVGKKLQFLVFTIHSNVHWARKNMDRQ